MTDTTIARIPGAGSKETLVLAKLTDTDYESGRSILTLIQPDWRNAPTPILFIFPEQIAALRDALNALPG